MTIPKLKHIRFNKTQKKNQNNTNNTNNSNISHILKNFTRNRKTIKPRKIIIFPLHFKNNTKKNKILTPQFTIRRKFGNYSKNIRNNTNFNRDNIHNNNLNNNTTIAQKRNLLKRYIQIKRRKMTTFKNENSYNNKRTPIYNSYVPGSGVGASNIATRRHKQKYAYLQ